LAAEVHSPYGLSGDLRELSTGFMPEAGKRREAIMVRDLSRLRMAL
jgi:hypothetical protein